MSKWSLTVTNQLHTLVRRIGSARFHSYATDIFSLPLCWPFFDSLVYFLSVNTKPGTE